MLKKLLEGRAVLSVLLLAVAVGLFLNLFTLWTRDTGTPLAFAQSGAVAVAIAPWGSGGVAMVKIIGQDCHITFFNSSANVPATYSC